MFMLSPTSRTATCYWIERINQYCAREYTNSILFVYNSAQRCTVCTQEYTDIIIGVSPVLGRRRTQKK